MTKDRGGGRGRGGDGKEVGELDNIPTLPTSLHLCWPQENLIKEENSNSGWRWLRWILWFVGVFPPDLRVSRGSGRTSPL